MGLVPFKKGEREPCEDTARGGIHEAENKLLADKNLPVPRA
jgi:hypothetical protein